MTDPAARRHDHDQATRGADRDSHVSEDERRSIDATEQVYGAYDDPDEAIRTSEPTRTGGPSLFEIEGDVETSDTVPGQPYHDGIGPFSTPIIVIVVALVIFVALLVTFG